MLIKRTIIYNDIILKRVKLKIGDGVCFYCKYYQNGKVSCPDKIRLLCTRASELITGFEWENNRDSTVIYDYVYDTKKAPNIRNSNIEQNK